MIDVSVDIHGLSDVEQALHDISNDDSIAGAKVIRSAMMTASLPIFRQMQATAPVAKDPRPRKRKSRRGGTVEIRPGFLRTRIRRRSYINKFGYGSRNIGRMQNEANSLVKVRIGVYTPYAHYVELGTEHSPAQPFIRSAIDGHWQGITQKFGTLLERRLLSYRRRQARRNAT